MFEDIVKEVPIVIDKSMKDDKVPTRPGSSRPGSSRPGSSGTGQQTMRGISNSDKVTLYGINGEEFIRITHVNDVYVYGDKNPELRKDVILDALFDWLVDMGYDQ